MTTDEQILAELRRLTRVVEAVQADVAALRRPTSPEAMQALLRALAARFGAKLFTVRDAVDAGLVDPRDTRSVGRALVKLPEVAVVGHDRDGAVYALCEFREKLAPVGKGPVFRA